MPQNTNSILRVREWEGVPHLIMFDVKGFDIGEVTVHFAISHYLTLTLTLNPNLSLTLTISLTLTLNPNSNTSLNPNPKP